MSVNNVNQNTDIQKLLKLMKSNQGAKAGMAKKVPAHMTMNGSIFNANANTISSTGRANNTDAAKSANNVLAANTAKSISNVSSTSSAAKAQNAQGLEGQEENNKKVDIGNYDFDNLTQVSDSELSSLKEQLSDLKDSDIPRFLQNGIEKKLGKVKSEMQKRASGQVEDKSEAKAEEKAKDGESAKTDAKDSAKETSSGTKQAEQGTQQMNQTQSEMKSLDQKMKADDKKLQKQMKAGQKQIDKNQKKMEKEAEKLEDKAKEIETATAEIEQLSGIAQSETATAEEKADAQQKIQTSLGKVGTIQKDIQKGNVSLKKIQTKSNKQVRTLSRTAKTYQKVSKQNVQNVQNAQQESNKVLDVANKVDEIAGYTVTAGQVTQYIGRGMQCIPYTAAAGRVVETVGSGVEMVGQYGKCAANVTKTAVYAAQGNIAGAFMSAGAAVMSGVSAAKATQQFSNQVSALKNVENVGKGVETTATEAGDKAKEPALKGGKFSKDDLLQLGGSLQTIGQMIGNRQQQPVAGAGRRSVRMAQHAQRRKLR